jgi:hypothetical protein
MVNYGNSKIYKIEPIVPHDEGEVYYGATTKYYLSSRWGNYTTDHRNNKRRTTASILFDKYGIDNCRCDLVEMFPCNSKAELSAREGEYIRDNNCVNKQVSGRGKIEYRKYYQSIPENRARKTELQRIRRGKNISI